jgi:hypothetical protein
MACWRACKILDRAFHKFICDVPFDRSRMHPLESPVSVTDVQAGHSPHQLHLAPTVAQHFPGPLQVLWRVQGGLAGVGIGLALLSAWALGWVGFWSALLAVAVCGAGMMAFGGVLAWGLRSAYRADPATVTLRCALRAEAAKMIVLVVLLWAVFSGFPSLSAPVFIAVFVVSVVLSGFLFAVWYRS